MNISKTLLIHSCSAYKVTGMNADRQPVYGSMVSLTNVWIDMTDSQNNGTKGKENADSGTFFFDCLNSSPSSFVPEKNMKIVFDGKNLTVNSIKKCYGLNGLEHYECGVF